MASRTFTKTLRAPLARQLASPAIQQRAAYSVARTATRAAIAAARPAVAQCQQVRGVKTMDFAGSKETVYERADWPQEKLLVSFTLPPPPNVSPSETIRPKTAKLTTDCFPHAAGVLQERHTCSDRLRLAGPRPGPEPPRQRPQRHHRCPQERKVVAGRHPGRLGPRQEPV